MGKSKKRSADKEEDFGKILKKIKKLNESVEKMGEKLALKDKTKESEKENMPLSKNSRHQSLTRK